MSLYLRCLCWLAAVYILALQPLAAEPGNASDTLEARTRLLLEDLDKSELKTVASGGGLKISDLNIRIEGCAADPYGESQDMSRAARTLVDDLRQGLHEGLQYLGGQGPQGELESNHRYQNRAALLFHELVHWLGHEHTAFKPDRAHLYETCCFGGSDYISDSTRNDTHQQTACDILKDDELWSQHNRPHRQMRLWHHKGYDRLKTRMRSDYDA